MAFEYCCFISYPHGQDDVLRPIVKNFLEGLEVEIKALTRTKPAWTDHIMKGGNKVPETIGLNLCKSACMILLYTPLYFDAENVWCAREFQAMQKLENKRLCLLADKSNGLIIPIILRGENKFPKSISNINYIKFTDIEFNNPRHKIRVKYASKIKEIAEYIVDRCKELDAASNNISHDCSQFALPSPEEAKRFVENLPDFAVGFVGRTENPGVLNEPEIQ
jgi:hypothetical protein